MLAVALSLTGCDHLNGAAKGSLAGGQAISASEEARPDRDPAGRVLYVTDRTPVVSPNGAPGFGAQRSRVLRFGLLTVAMTGTGDRASQAEVGAPQALGAFPETPYPTPKVPGGVRRDPATARAHEAARSALQRAFAESLAQSPRKEAIVFVHGYNNSFEDSARSGANLCDLVDRDFACVILSWPAGGSRGAFFGYNVDRESGEFAVSDIRKTLRALGTTPALRKLHVIAHSRGSDVVTSALQQLALEAYAAGMSLSALVKLYNLVLFAPDIDIDVAASKIFTIASDPDILRLGKATPFAILPETTLHLTVYSSPDDKALGLSGSIFGSIARLGQVTPDSLDPNLRPHDAPDLGGLVDLIEVPGGSDFIGHSYFLSDQRVRADLVALIRDGAKAGSPRRPLIEIKRPFWRLAPPRSGA